MVASLSSLIRSFALQYRVIGALILREIYTRFGRENLGFLWVIGEPVLFCTGVTIMWSFVHPNGEHNLSIVGFVITGYNPLTMWRHCVFRSIKAFESNGSLLFHRQVTTLDIIFARLLVEYYGSTVGFILTAGVAMLLGLMDPPKDLPLVFAGWFFVMLFSAGTALLMAGLSEMSEIVEKLIGVMTYVSIPFSGAFTMVDWVPEKMQKYLLLSPSVHAFEMIRGGWFGEQMHPKYSFVFTTWSCLLMILVGLYVTKRARRYLVVV